MGMHTAIRPRARTCSARHLRSRAVRTLRTNCRSSVPPLALPLPERPALRSGRSALLETLRARALCKRFFS
eukprot:7333390-Alexandrium_andersonii.AAC.1